MHLTLTEKENIKREIIQTLSSAQEIEKIVLFGSFIKSKNPNDVDIAIFQNSSEKYLTLAMKYRKMVRIISKKIPVDIIPLRGDKTNEFVSSEIETGEIIYEKGN